ncbi:hypothetical protein [Vibrio europaeus]|uniref:defense against restriction DarA-related protein n=1 Tax=Vibrio europaeus TaxID=300876 RepID=UPI00233EB54C|nr:hypothetical protein [Vibrio europaeus]MDC5753530.1 hypothetical protein [Vibrio europaeus]MDC5816557.1 hypothetical protein [Vibrio europaeus]
MIHSKNRKTYHVFDFEDFNERGLKGFIALLKRAGSEVSGVTATNRVVRKDGEKTKKATLFFLNGQKAEIQIGDQGDVVNVKLNGRVTPVKSETSKALADSLNDALERGQEAFSKSLAKKMAKLDTDKPNKAPAGRSMAARNAEIDELIAQVKSDLEAAKEELKSLNLEGDGARAEINQLREEIARFKKQIADLTTELSAKGVTA